MSWTYLIKFADKTVPEKQSIDVAINAVVRRRIPVGATALNPLLLPVIDVIETGKSNINVRIAHTARTWGTDIENIINDQISRWARKDSAFHSFVKKNYVYISLLISTLFFVICETWLYRSCKPIYDKALVASENAKVLSVDLKMNYIIDFIQNNPNDHATARLAFGTVIIFAITIVLLVSLVTMGDFPTRSHLALSSKAKEKREEYERDKKWTLRYFIGTAIGSTISGLASKLLFENLSYLGF